MDVKTTVVIGGMVLLVLFTVLVTGRVANLESDLHTLKREMVERRYHQHVEVGVDGNNPTVQYMDGISTQHWVSETFERSYDE